jgi:hypothetical protein
LDGFLAAEDGGDEGERDEDDQPAAHGGNLANRRCVVEFPTAAPWAFTGGTYSIRIAFVTAS